MSRGLGDVYKRQVLDCSVIMSSHLEDDIRKEFDYIGQFEHGEFTSFYENA